MPSHLEFGPSIARYRTSLSSIHVIGLLSVGPLIVLVGILFAPYQGGYATMWWCVCSGLILLLVSVLYLAWSASAFVQIYHGGLVVGRSAPGAMRREVRFDEIHPASIRVFRDIDDVRSLPYRVLHPSWYFTGGADLAVTFVAPEPGSLRGIAPRPPAPGPGIVLFGSRQAVEIAEQIRRGLERSGCPPHLSRWSEQFGVVTVNGMGSRARASIPGMRTDWSV